MNYYNKSVQEQRYKHQRRESINNPSFSSTLLDAIYRSIDEAEDNHKTMKKTKHSGLQPPIASAAAMKVVEEDDIESFRRACFDEKGLKTRRKSMADFENEKSRIDNEKMRTTISCYSMQTQNRPRHVRTSLSSSKPQQEGYYDNSDCVGRGHPKNDQKLENGFVKTIKKVKQPISPGGKLASFLNSIFNNSSSKKSRKNFVDHHHNSRFGGYESTTSTSTTTATCSSASSFSRSYLSKNTTTSSTQSSCSISRNNNVNTKRTVRFCPVSTVILDEDCPREKAMYATRDSISVMMEESRRVEEAARDLLKKYKKNEDEFDRRMMKNGNKEYEDDDDDAASCASSDLFELDNLSAIGIDQKRYGQELPVYETTHLDTNIAIAKGLIV